MKLLAIAGLRFESVDFTHHSIYVGRTLQYDKEDKRLFLDTTKTGENRVEYTAEPY
ncbi:hypothetical protein ACQKMD_12360 [Viridibacillus sp. NPDC096237]|uniref:hypothetical protein n=1 Tax=Viridibacillus sp. NPDC096237 TaxID=3390721 RepID=UPI003D033B2D